MSDNPQYGTTRPFALPAMRVLELQGRDAVAFAQSQFMNDVAGLRTGRWQWNGWLDPKGRVQALFLLLRPSEDTLLAATCADTDALAAGLRRFVFRSKVMIGASMLQASGLSGGATDLYGGTLAQDADGIELSPDGIRVLRLARDPAAPDDEAARLWWAASLRQGWPDVPGARLDAWTPQQLSLQRFPAFSVRKGCYPGQEIVARTHFLGRAKREAVLFELDHEAPGDELRADDGAVAAVVARAGRWCLAVAPCERAAGGWRLGDVVAVERAFVHPDTTPASGA